MEAAVASSRAKLLRSQSLPAFEHCLLSISGNKWRDDLVIANRPPTASTANGDHNKVDGNKKSATIRQHYYPEAGWGWVITICASYVLLICHGLHMAYGILYLEVLQKFGRDRQIEAVWLGALSSALSMVLTPVVVALCRRKSTRLTAVLGGLTTALGCLFTSFASQFHQLFFSFGIMTGIGIGLVRDTSNLMVGQYFKRKREMVEIVVVGSSGLGIAITSLLIHHSIQAVGWRLGLQAITGLVFVSFFLGVFYRSASLYHPQRRAILHLKNQKRKMKEKIKSEENKQQFFDFKTLKSRTFQIVLTSAAVGAFGISTPIVFLAYEAKQDGLSTESVLVIQVFLGIAFALGCGTFGFIIIRNSSECRIARQYLCQASTFMVAAATVAFTSVHGYHGYVFFAWIYGLFCGSYNYTLKMFMYEKVRAHNFALAWSFIQWAQSIPMAFGAPITGYMNSSSLGNRSGYYFSSACVLTSSIVLLLVDVHKRQIHKLQRSKYSSSVLNHQKCFHSSCVHNHLKDNSTLPDLDGRISAVSGLHSRCYSVNDLRHPELTCISEEGIADLGDNMFDDYDQYLADCMTSCDQVEHYLMLSEYENNLIKTREIDSIVDRSKRRKSLNKFQRINTLGNSEDLFLSMNGNEDQKSDAAEKLSTNNSSKDGASANFNAWKLLQKTSCNIPTVINEITTAL